MSENSNTNATTLRREARRRRILENSENRLKSIIGKASVASAAAAAATEDQPESDACLRSRRDTFDGDIEKDIFAALNAGKRTSENDIKKDFESKFDGDFGCGPQDIEAKVQGAREEKTFFGTLIEKRFHYVALSVIVHVLLFCQLGFLFYENLFCPFITVKLVECMLLEEYSRLKKPNLQTMMACISRGSVISHVCKALSVTASILSDFFLYLFVFVLNHKLFDAISVVSK